MCGCADPRKAAAPRAQPRAQPQTPPHLRCEAVRHAVLALVAAMERAGQLAPDDARALTISLTR